MNDDQVQGKEEVLNQLQAQEETLASRAKTAGDRLDAFFEKQPKYGEEPKPQEAEAVNQPEPVPSSNTTQAEEAKPNLETPAVQEPPQIEEQPTLPDAASDRTKEQFQKLLEENRRLKEEARKQAGNSVFDSIRSAETNVTPSLPQVPGVEPWNPVQGFNNQVPQIDARQFTNLNQPQVNQIANQFVAPDGTVDIDGLNKALLAANSQAKRAEDRAFIAETEARMTRQEFQRQDEQRQAREAHKEFPALDPKSDEFDPEFFKKVSTTLANEWKSGRRPELIEVAKQVQSTNTSPINLDKVKQDAIADYKKTQEARVQGPLESGRGEPREATDTVALRERTRKGDPFALDERMKKLGIIS